MRHSDGGPRDLVEQVIRTGVMLADVLTTLLDELPHDAFPEAEEAAEALLDMVASSFLPATEAAGEAVVREATALVGALGDRAIEDLQRARALAREDPG